MSARINYFANALKNCAKFCVLVIVVMNPQLSIAQTTNEQTLKLENALKAIEKEMIAQEHIVAETGKQRQSLERDIKLIEAEIKQAQMGIHAQSLAINQLSSQIGEKEEVLSILDQRLTKQRQSVSDLVRKSAAMDDISLVELFLNNKNFSDFFIDVAQFHAIKRSLNESTSVLKNIKEETEGQKVVLTEKQQDEMKLKQLQEVQKHEIETKEKQKETILNVTKGQEAKYQKVLQAQRQTAAEIRSALFRLRGADGGGIKFSDALAYAKIASAQTGVRTAFILAILRQESNLGVNVGQCLLVDPITGAGKGKNTSTPFPNTMKPDRDVPYFLDMMKRLGRDPYLTPVSCPQSVGYGGAMGPTQFIPSTWQGYEARIARAFNVSVADPWDPQHAIMATAMFLQDLGAARGGVEAEREAAGRYYAGGNWQTYGLSYASSVLTYATNYQNDINFLQNN